MLKDDTDLYRAQDFTLKFLKEFYYDDENTRDYVINDLSIDQLDDITEYMSEVLLTLFSKIAERKGHQVGLNISCSPENEDE